jgi:hypothetical protein
MHCLEIVAELKFLKPIPDYLDISCVQRIAAFVSGDSPPDEEIRRLEVFRRTVVRLMKEGLHHEPGCDASELPYVSLTIEAGEECRESTWRMDAFIDMDDKGRCRLRYSAGEDADRDHRFAGSEDALAEIKRLLDRETGRWAAQVVFAGGKRAGM